MEQGIIELAYKPSTELEADIFTKALTQARHEEAIRGLGLFIQHARCEGEC